MIVYGRDYNLLKTTGVVWREEKPRARKILDEFRRLRQQYGNDFNSIQKGIWDFYKKLPPDHLALKHRRYNRVDRNSLWRDNNISWPGGNGPRYDVIHPITHKPCTLPDGGWRFAALEKFQLYLKHDFIEFRADHTEPPILKRYLNYVSTDFDSDARRLNATISDEENGEDANV
jgi:adenine-specific DNA-methyltransferase